MKALVLKIENPTLDGITLEFEGIPLFGIVPVVMEPDEAIMDLFKDSMDKDWVLKVTSIIQSTKIQCARIEIVNAELFPMKPDHTLNYVLSFEKNMLENPMFYAATVIKKYPMEKLYIKPTIKSIIGKLALYDISII